MFAADVGLPRPHSHTLALPTSYQDIDVSVQVRFTLLDTAAGSGAKKVESIVPVGERGSTVV